MLDEDQSGVLDRATHTIVQQVDAMKQMVNAFSDYAKPSVIDKDTKPLELDSLLKEVVTLYLSSPKVEIEADYGAESILLHADPVKLRQLIHNLIKNGIEALDSADDARITISTQDRMEGHCHYVELKIEDNGPGFDADVIERVFDPYVTTKSGGTGLGLAIVRKIVDEHGGGIWIFNRQQGASVILRFPVWHDGEECDVVPAPAMPDTQD